MERSIETKIDKTNGMLFSETTIEFKGTLVLHNGVICSEEVTTSTQGYAGTDELEMHEVIFNAVSEAVTKFMKERRDS